MFTRTVHLRCHTVGCIRLTLPLIGEDNKKCTDSLIHTHIVPIENIMSMKMVVFETDAAALRRVCCPGTTDAACDNGSFVVTCGDGSQKTLACPANTILTR